MNSYDFGQFLFNTAFLDETQLANLIVAAKNKKSTLATKALFLRMVTIPELETSLKNLQASESLDEYLRSHDKRLERMEETASLWLVQELIDSGTVDAEQLEKLLGEYHKLEIPPVEDAYSSRYDSLPPEQKPDYPFAVDVVKSFHEFASKSFATTMILLPDTEIIEGTLLGATVKIKGNSPVIVGIFAEEPIFLNFAQNYNNLVETKEDALDAIAEFLNIYAGHLTIHMVEVLGTDEEPETPRFGDAENFTGIKMLGDCGNFYMYVGKDEFFQEEINKQADGLDDFMDLSQFGLEDLGDDFDEKLKDPFDF